VNLIEPDPLARVKFAPSTHEKLDDLHPADLAEMMEELSAASARASSLPSMKKRCGGAGRTGRAADDADCREILDPEKAADILEGNGPDACGGCTGRLAPGDFEELLEEDARARG